MENGSFLLFKPEENKYHKSVGHPLDLILACYFGATLKLRPYLIGIAGPSCAGKSELSRRLSRILCAPILSLDSYYRDLSHLSLQERAATNFDSPEALDKHLLARHLGLLAGGFAIQKPVYDFANHTRTAATEPLRPGRFVIVEGLFALHWEEIRALFGTRVFITVPDEVCYQRRLERDVRERGRAPESVLEQYQATVRPMAEQYIHPTRRFAHLVASGTDPLERTTARVLAHIEKGMLEHRPQREDSLFEVLV